MCGIIGYLGKQNALPIVFDGLKRLEYRGYDSAGLVIFNRKKAKSIKAVGKLEELEKKITGLSLEGNLAIGHTRWATHGRPIEKNAHPHTDCQKRI